MESLRHGKLDSMKKISKFCIALSLVSIVTAWTAAPHPAQADDSSLIEDNRPNRKVKRFTDEDHRFYAGALAGAGIPVGNAVSNVDVGAALGLSAGLKLGEAGAVGLFFQRNFAATKISGVDFGTSFYGAEAFGIVDGFLFGARVGASTVSAYSGSLSASATTFAMGARMGYLFAASEQVRIGPELQYQQQFSSGSIDSFGLLNPVISAVVSF